MRAADLVLARSNRPLRDRPADPRRRLVIPLAKPHEAIICNSMWALTDFTAANGATRLVPGSHRRESPAYGCEVETVPAEMRRGSVLIWHGSLWHGGGANQTGERRVGIAMNYCAGFIRQQRNQPLGIPHEIAPFLPRLRELVGYGSTRPDRPRRKQSPARCSTRDESKMVWDL